MNINKKVIDLMNGNTHCPVCGGYLEITISFKGRKHYRNKRKKQVCTFCDWSCILPTEREALIQLNKL